MSAPHLLFACSRCFSRHPFEELSSGQQLCKECRGTFPVVKCTYCRSEFQQTAKGSTSTICKKCEQNVKAYGKPSACEYCNIIAAFIGNKCQRCTNSELKYGPPVTCEQCKQKCAFEKPRDNDDKKLEDIYSGGKLLCWLCALAYKRALARTKQSDADRRAHLKMTQKRDAKHRDHNRLKSHNKRPHRVDLTKQSSNDQGNGSGNGNDSAPPNKVSRSGGGGGGGGGGGAGSGLPGGRAAPIGEFDPNSSDHVVAMTQLKEKIASLQKLVSQKDSLILSKDKMITELKAKHFTVENELRNQMKTTQRDHDNKCDMLNGKIQTLLKEVATLSKSTKKDRLAAARESSTNSGSGTDSPSIP